LLEQLAVANRNRDFKRADQLQAAMARHLEPSNPFARLEGGAGGLVLWVDETRVPPEVLSA